jgi:formylmethanofuran dehydrogenase subunit E
VDAWAISMSFLLQLGMPLAELCAKFKGTRFEPSGNTDNPNIRIALSPIDYIARWLHGRFVDTELFEDAPIEEVEPTCQKCGSARPLHLSRGKMLCDPCASGKAPEAQP